MNEITVAGQVALVTGAPESVISVTLAVPFNTPWSVSMTRRSARVKRCPARLKSTSVAPSLVTA